MTIYFLRIHVTFLIVNILLNKRDPSSELQVAMRLTQLPRAPCKSIIAVAPVTPIVGNVAGAMMMFPVGVEAWTSLKSTLKCCIINSFENIQH